MVGGERGGGQGGEGVWEEEAHAEETMATCGWMRRGEIRVRSELTCEQDLVRPRGTKDLVRLISYNEKNKLIKKLIREYLIKQHSK